MKTTIKELKDTLRCRLEVNGVKNENSMKGKLIEMEFLQGFICAHCKPGIKPGSFRYKDVNPAVFICIQSGRSILTLKD